MLLACNYRQTRLYKRVTGNANKTAASLRYHNKTLQILSKAGGTKRLLKTKKLSYWQAQTKTNGRRRCTWNFTKGVNMLGKRNQSNVKKLVLS